MKELWLLLAGFPLVLGYTIIYFNPKTRQFSDSRTNTFALWQQPGGNQRWNQEIEENSRRKASGGAGETLAGAVLGGLIGGYVNSHC